MIGVRLNAFNDNSGEPEQDANSALTELDKGLRSGKVGEQCEAIVRFPRLFEKYPFPILINSSFLKLSDVFRMGNNFLRLWVLRVCQQSEKHLDKIVNVDEFVRRVFSVLHSNDSVARALALRTLGAVAGIIPERQNVHHAIRRGLDSHDNVEVDAAIYATTRFAAHSNSFAVSMCNKLSDMVECESTGAERRAKLVRALRTVHGGAVRAQGLLQLLHSLLDRFPSATCVRAAVAALTAIAADTVVHVPDQVEVLLNLASNDGRSAVRAAALAGLRRLAALAALWPPGAIDRLVAVAAGARDDNTTMLCLQVIQILVKCPAVCSAVGSPRAGEQSSLREYCLRTALGSPAAPAAAAATALTSVLRHCYEEHLPVDGSELMMALETLVVTTGVEDNPADIPPLRIALRCMVQLSEVEPLYASRTARMLSAQLSTFEDWGGARAAALLEALAALGGVPGGNLLPMMDKASAAADSGRSLVLASCVVLQQAARAGRSGAALRPRLRSADGWTRYKVARAALRYGHHALAASILQQLREEAPTETVQRWLNTLYIAAAADDRLQREGISGLEAAASCWEVSAGTRSGACAGGCPGCGACRPVPRAWRAARAAALRALAAAARAAAALCSQPPPAVAQSARTAAGRAGACATAARAAARAAAGVASLYHSIAETAFHTDDSTLRHLHIQQYTYSQLAEYLDRITGSEEPLELAIQEPVPLTLEETIAMQPSKKITAIAAKLFDNPTTGVGITHRHAEAMLAMAGALSRGALWPRGAAAALGEAPLCRVSLAPAPADHAVPAPADHALALKLEGVLLPQLFTKRQERRQVKAVQITVTATPHPRTSEKCVELAQVAPVLRAVQTVTPVRDFFSAQQLVSGPPGVYTVHVHAACIDQRARLWNTGPRTALVIKIHEDPATKSNPQGTRSRF